MCDSDPNSNPARREPQSVLEAAVHRALADLIESGGQARTLEVHAVGGGWSLTLTAEAAGPPLARVPRPPALTPCQRDIMAVLSVYDRLTTTEVLEQLDRRGLIHGVSTVKHALAGMVREGRICSSSRAPRGYSLPAQTTDTTHEGD